MVSQNTASLNTGSYLTRTDYSLFVQGKASDLWYGFSANDVIELGVFDYDQNLIAWGVLNQDKKYNTRTLTQINTLNYPVTYSYSELVQDFILYKNQKILVSPPAELTQSAGISEGSYVLSYNFTREMAGNVRTPLVIKDISPSRKEIKLVPIGLPNNQYTAFCKKNVLISDVSSLYLQLIKGCPYSQIYNQISSQYVNEINTIKNLFFLTTDADFITFLKNIYEDLIIYTRADKDAQGNIITFPEQLLRIQGIRTYFSNYLLLNSEKISNFTEIDANFNAFTKASIERKFSVIGKNPSKEYVKAKEFVYDFFTKYFYNPITTTLSTTFNEKYYSYLKNALNFGSGRLLPIIDHDSMDERVNSGDPLTLLVKLPSELPNDIMTQTVCWVSNISLVPYIVYSIIKNPQTTNVTKIGRPNFSIPLANVSQTNVNKSYTADDLKNDDAIDREIVISKKQSEISIDYTDFKNFVIFSSAELRLNIFKNKMIQISTLSSSLKTLENKNTAFLSASGSLYPFYTEEYDSIQTQTNEIVAGFDGYESYLYRTGIYQYSASSFISASYISILDTSASYYDKYNRDSLINNTPQHIILDENNDDYLVFLSMMGHFFDDIYVYIANLPSEKTVGQSSDETFSRLVIDYMLETFGWKLDTTLEQSTLINNYLTADEISGLNSLSAEERVKIIRNRILVNLSQIYKTKGTEEAVKMLLSCYGVPTGLLQIREYGGIDYTEENATYTQYEKSFMYQWNSASVSDYFKLSFPPRIKTIEYKFSIPDQSPYAYNDKQILWGVVPNGATIGSVTGSGFIHGGFLRERGLNMGRVFFSVGYEGNEDFTIYSDPVPIFDGNVYSVMVRRNDPDPLYQYYANDNEVPTKYDLYVQRNESGRPVVKSITSHINYDSHSNYTFDTSGYLMIGGWFYGNNGVPYAGTFDKLMLWIDPVPTPNFEDHVNNINSYSFTGSRDAYKSLIFRMHTDYPFDMRQHPPQTYDNSYFTSSVDVWWGKYTNANSYYVNSGSSKFLAETGHLVGGVQNLGYLFAWSPNTGSQKLVYDSATCLNVSQSIYPYQFKIIDSPNTYTISKYGPNRFRNEKIKYISQSVEARFDINERSTHVGRNTTSPDSNLVGFYVDPQDFKNKDIIRYFGNYDFMNVIGASSMRYDEQYDHLRVLRKTYSNIANNVSGSNPRFNEMMTIYKLYFNRSIFESIRNLNPARSNVVLGVIVEPTILERPKYQNKSIFNEMNSGSAMYFDVTASKYFRDPNTKMVRISEVVQSGDFNLDLTQEGSDFDASTLPKNLYTNLDFSYLNDPSRVYPFNYLNNGTDVNDLPDKYQFSHFGSSQFIPMDGEEVTGKVDCDMNYEAHPSSSVRYYMLKVWNKYSIYNKDGAWNRTSNPLDNTYVTNSIHLYKYILVSEDLFKSMVYTTETSDNVLSDVYLLNKFVHHPNTFKLTPNQKFNNISASFKAPIGLDPSQPYFMFSDDNYLEIVQGYPRNHYTHKRQIFSPYRVQKIEKEGGILTTSTYIKSQQTSKTTIGTDTLEDGTYPVQSFDVSNVNLTQGNNVINQ